MQQACAEFTALKHALVKAGTPIESIQILIEATLEASVRKDLNGELPDIKLPTNDKPAKQLWTKLAVTSLPFMQRKTWRPEKPEPTTPTTVDEESSDEAEHRSMIKRSYSNCHGDRSVVLAGVPKSTTLQDINRSIRGGALLNVFRRHADQTVHVAFVEPANAEAFMRYVKKNDLYIKSKRVEVSWDDRQHYMTGGLARRIRHEGATRNLVIRFPNPGVTAEIIRDDLEHIHLLEVVSLHLADSHAWISLNSVQHAVTARNCMRSRFRYKGSSIQFWPDGCARPWQNESKSMIQSWKAKGQANVSTISVNRFDGLMEYDNDETSSESGSDA